jgi:hypothetical protein
MLSWRDVIQFDEGIITDVIITDVASLLDAASQVGGEDNYAVDNTLTIDSMTIAHLNCAPFGYRPQGGLGRSKSVPACRMPKCPYPVMLQQQDTARSDGQNRHSAYRNSSHQSASFSGQTRSD